MCRLKLCAVWFCFAILVSACFAQDPADGNTSSTSCTFADGQQISLRYTKSTKEPNMNGVWAPGGKPMFLFTQTAVTVHGTQLSPGAYSVWLTGKKGAWSLIVNKNVKADAAYDAKDDLAREPMESGKLGAPEKTMRLYFVHPEAKTCSLRIYYQDTGYFGEFKEQ